MPLQLLDLTSEMQLLDSVQDGDTITAVPVKGFASVEMVDRDGEITSPLEFDIETFMNSPTLLENHKFLKDEFGNERSAGRVTSAVPAYIAEESGEFDWAIKHLKTHEPVNVLPKAKVPNLKIGDRGLFITAEVTNPKSIEKVLRGELGGLSWRGLSLSVKDGGVTRLKRIDLFEISLVNIPAVSQATFMVGKSKTDKGSWQSIDRENVRVFKMRFEKSRFADAELVSKYLKLHEIEPREITETDDDYFAVLQRPSLFEVEKSFAIPMGGVSVIAAPVKDEDMTSSVAELVGHVKTHPVKRDSKMPDSATPEAKTVQKLYLLDENFLTQFPQSKATLQKSAGLEDGTTLEVYSLEFVANDPVLTVTNGTSVDTVGTSTTAPVAVEAPVETPAENPEVAALKQQLQELRDAVAALRKPEEKAPEQTAQDEIESLKSQIEQVTIENQKSLEKLVDAFNKLVPVQTPRAESVKSATKMQDKKNETSVGELFASVLPFVG